MAKRDLFLAHRHTAPGQNVPENLFGYVVGFRIARWIGLHFTPLFSIPFKANDGQQALGVLLPTICPKRQK